jgi:O-antigen/teichoic acid export membrane protein
MKMIKKLTQINFARNVIIVASGTAMAQVVGVVFTPIITRIYGPEAFGLMGTFVSLATMASSVSALTYPYAMILPKKDSDAKDIARLSVWVSIGTASLATILILVGGNGLFVLLSAQAIAAFGLLIPLHMLFSAWLRIGQQWFIRNRQFKSTAKIEVLQSFIVNSAKTLVGLVKPLAAVLIIFTTLGIGLNVLMFYLSTGKSDRKEQKPDEPEKETKASLLQLAKKYYDFPLYRAPVALLEDVSSNIPVLMLSAFFGPASAGFYVLGYKLLKAPSKLIGRSVSNVFFPKITKAAHDGKDLKRLLLNATLGLAAAGFIPYAAIFIFGPWIFKIVFGAEWTTAGEYARWISFFVFFQFLYRPSAVAIITLGLQKQFLIYEVVSLALKLAAIYAGFIIFKNDITAIILYSTTGGLSFLALILWVLALSKKGVRQERFSGE